MTICRCRATGIHVVSQTIVVKDYYIVVLCCVLVLF